MTVTIRSDYYDLLELLESERGQMQMGRESECVFETERMRGRGCVCACARGIALPFHGSRK
jgi:hypothetical protein